MLGSQQGHPRLVWLRVSPPWFAANEHSSHRCSVEIFARDSRPFALPEVRRVEVGDELVTTPRYGEFGLVDRRAFQVKRLLAA